VAADVPPPDRAGPAPLAGVRVLDLLAGLGELGPRYLADLGADVIRVEPPGGGRSRGLAPCADGVSLRYLTHNAGKRAVEADLGTAAGRSQFRRLAATADIIFEPGPAGWLTASGITPPQLRAQFPALVVVSVSDFGWAGPYRDWQATEQVLLAMSGVLSRSGLPGRAPLIPPGQLASESVALQAAWVALAAYLQRLRTGSGDHADVSAFEATALTLDPGFGIGGSATAGAAAGAGARGRPDARHLYPIFRCADGWVRICVLSARQWAGMFRWLGEPAELADPALAGMGARHQAAAVLMPAYERHFAGLLREEAVAQGQQHGVPTAALLTLAEVADSEHFRARRAFAEVPLGPGRAGVARASRVIRVPDGLAEIDGQRAGLRGPAPAAGEHTAEILGGLIADPGEPPAGTEEHAAGSGEGGLPGGREAEPGAGEPAAGPASDGVLRPLAGVRVLDLGVIVVGAELGRLLADLGAEVIKVENRAFPDGSRQALAGEAITAGFAAGHRNKSSIGLNLRDERGKDLFRALAARSDIVLSNFKPGTLESLGLGYADLAAVNPGIIMADSSAFGPTGPWSRRMGYGPLVRASSGLTDLWRYPDDEGSFSDASTIFPDHVGARVSAVAVLAKLIERRRTSRGGTVSVAQAETILGELSTEIALESVTPGAVPAGGSALPADAPRGAYPAAGDDEWVVITVRDDADFAALAGALGQPQLAGAPGYATAAGRAAGRAQIDTVVTAWTRSRSPGEAAAALQAAGVPAGPMLRITEHLSDPHLAARGFLTPTRHPLLAGPVPGERASAVFERMPDPPLEPAPLAGQQTRELAGRLLGLSAPAIQSLVDDGILEEPPPVPPAPSAVQPVPPAVPAREPASSPPPSPREPS
jgi:crotonobetainyl-CoA:carnitine CoA-transferase CaiB-like acyl-CoA transferase